MFGKEKLTKAKKKYKKYKKSLKLFKNKNIRANIVYLYELTYSNNREINEKYDSDKKILGQRKLNIFIECYNRIREIINSKDIDFINSHIFEIDQQLYNILDDEEENISKNSKDTNQNKKNTNNNIINKNINKNIDKNKNKESVNFFI